MCYFFSRCVLIVLIAHIFIRNLQLIMLELLWVIVILILVNAKIVPAFLFPILKHGQRIIRQKAKVKVTPSRVVSSRSLLFLTVCLEDSYLGLHARREAGQFLFSELRLSLGFYTINTKYARSQAKQNCPPPLKGNLLTELEKVLDSLSLTC